MADHDNLVKELREAFTRKVDAQGRLAESMRRLDVLRSHYDSTVERAFSKLETLALVAWVDGEGACEHLRLHADENSLEDAMRIAAEEPEHFGPLKTRWLRGDGYARGILLLPNQMVVEAEEELGGEVRNHMEELLADFREKTRQEQDFNLIFRQVFPTVPARVTSE